jgi:two-component system nitrogen regulation response regulator GlnG
VPPAESGLEAFIRRRLGPGAADLYAEAHREVDHILLPRVLEYTRGNQFQAARLLGIARQTLRRKVRELGLTVRFVDADEDDADTAPPPPAG